MLTARKVPCDNAVKLMRDMLRRSKPRRYRSMLQFMEQEITIPNGPHEGQKFRTRYQPHTQLLLNEIDSGRWPDIDVTGPVQSGKTFIGWVGPFMYHMFEIRETVICGLPHMEMAADKFTEDILPIIERTRYRELLPTRGGGSRGGKPVSVKFKHGKTLRFMSAGGSDKQRSGYTTRVVVMTEVDGMDEAGGGSNETDKVTQIENRAGSWGDKRRIYKECTVTVEDGRIWREYKNGTASLIHCKCIHCGTYVCPEREHLVGWQDAKDELAAKENTCFCCPACGGLIDEDQRKLMNKDCVLVHRGQEVDEKGRVRGALPRTTTFGYRWTAFNNLFVPASMIGVKEYRAKHAEDNELMEKELLQYVWVKPYVPPRFDDTEMKADHITCRYVEGLRRGFVPPDTTHLGGFIDVGRRLCHYAITAARNVEGIGQQLHVVDYGVWEVRSDEFDFEKALMIALREMADHFSAGYQVLGSEKRRVPDKMLIDAGWQGGQEGRNKVIYQFCSEEHDWGRGLFTPTLGRGTAQRITRKYTQPKQAGKDVALIGEHYHVIKDVKQKVFRVEIDSDYWKSFIHDRLRTSMDQAGALCLFEAQSHEHLSFAKHLTAETRVTDFDPSKGVLYRWERKRPHNHWLDAESGSCVALHIAGAVLSANATPDELKPQPAKPKRRPQYGVRTPGGDRYTVKIPRNH